MNNGFPGAIPVSLLEQFPFVVVGLGARSAATSAEIIALIDAVLAEHRLTRADIAFCTTIDRKADDPALREVARTLGISLVVQNAVALPRQVPTPSSVVASHIGIASVAEACALTFGSLLASKRRSANATCALARLQSLAAPIAANTPSMLPTSSAGP